MKLHYRHFACDTPRNQPLLVLHGLFGSHRNWAAIARRLSGQQEVYVPDLRNHGESPHRDTMTLADMAGDVLEFIEQRSLERIHLMGHSLGGKIAMQLSFSHPEYLDRLVVVDIAPRRYPPRHQAIFAAIDLIDEACPATRKEAENLIAPVLSDSAQRLFLLTNFTRDRDGRYTWRANMRAIRENYDAISAAPDMPGEQTFDAPSLFIRGAQSPYVTDNDIPRIKARFPNADVATLEAGHWVHADTPDALVTTLTRFLGPVHTI